MFSYLRAQSGLAPPRNISLAECLFGCEGRFSVATSLRWVLAPMGRSALLIM